MGFSEGTAEHRSAREVLAWSRNVVEPALRAALDTLPAPVWRIAGYPFGWWDEHGRLAAANTDNGLRPALALLAAEAVGGTATAAVPPAAAVELVHNFSLLHDDLLDGDVARRHRPTAWKVFGLDAAVLSGDALLTVAFGMLAASGHPAGQDGASMLGTAVLDLLGGQLAELAFEEREDVTLPEYVTMAEARTGAMMGCACALGALFGGGRPEQVTHLRGFGSNLGLALHFVDDLIGIWGDPSTAGEPSHSGLRGRRKSLPVVAALTSATPAGHELAALVRRQHPLAEAELASAAELIDRSGARALSEAKVDDLLAQALHRLRSAEPIASAAAELGALARLATGRYR